MVFKKGQISYNKGKRCLWVKKRDLKNNPMKNEKTRIKASQVRKELIKDGKIKIWNKGLTKGNNKIINEMSLRTSEKRKKLIKKGKLKPIKNLGKYAEKGFGVEENNPFYGKKHSEESKAKMKGSRLNFIGEKNPNWKGGLSFEPYDENFNNKFKRAIRKRDNHICMKCGIHQEKLTRTLDIHHINYDKKLTIPQNCISLCIKCNVEVNYNRKHWIKFFHSLMSTRYDYKYSEQGEVILEVKQ